MNKLADIDFGPLRGYGKPGLEGQGTFGLATEAELVLASVLSIVVGILTVVASVFFLFKIITGGISIISAGGDKGKVAEARTSITNGLVGLMIVLFSTIFIGFIGSILDIDFLSIASAIARLGNP